MKKTAVTITVLWVLAIAVLWAFPRFWYTRSSVQTNPTWFSPVTNLTGWSYQTIPVSQSAERLLVADQTSSGEFRAENRRAVVRAFAASRYTEKPNDIGLFVHTPDRCWTQGGWHFEPSVPDSIQTTVHGVPLVFERRVFEYGGHRELVYFGGLVGGQPLPYRLDHNLSVGMKYAVNERAQKLGSRGAGMRAVDTLFWKRIWDAFTARRQILGPKQFIRISTPAEGTDLAAKDKLLQTFLETWLQPVEYRAALQNWQADKS